MRFTNREAGLRGLNTLAGPVLVAPGETVDVEMSDVETAVAEATGWFDIVRPEPKSKTRTSDKEDSK